MSAIVTYRLGTTEVEDVGNCAIVTFEIIFNCRDISAAHVSVTNIYICDYEGCRCYVGMKEGEIAPETVSYFLPVLDHMVWFNQRSGYARKLELSPPR